MFWKLRTTSRRQRRSSISHHGNTECQKQHVSYWLLLAVWRLGECSRRRCLVVGEKLQHCVPTDIRGKLDRENSAPCDHANPLFPWMSGTYQRGCGPPPSPKSQPSLYCKFKQAWEKVWWRPWNVAWNSGRKTWKKSAGPKTSLVYLLQQYRKAEKSKEKVKLIFNGLIYILQNSQKSCNTIT